MYVPFAGDRGSKEAWMDLESQTMLNLISMLVQNSNHGRSPSEIAHDTLSASYPHHARGGVLTLPRKKWAHPPFQNSLCYISALSHKHLLSFQNDHPPWAIGDNFSTRRKVMRRGKLATDAK